MTQAHSSSRRNFIKGAGLATAGSLFATASSKAQTAASKDALKAKNMIFLVVDGMCNGTLALAHHWSLRNRNEPLNWMQLYNHPGIVRSYQDTASANSPVTDSAAAASAWGGGQRVNNGSINIAINGTENTPLMSLAKRAGKATGLVTSCRITHATPAGFATNVFDRNDEKTIAKQYLEREIDVILGGGRESIRYDDALGNRVNLFADFEQKGYEIVHGKADLGKAAGAPRLLGVFSKSHIPYAIDRQNDPSLKTVPSLPEMFEAALKSLSPAKNGFVLQVEGGRVDHAGHANDPGAILHELLEFDRCIPIALEFIEKNPDTLLIVTTDHGTGGCQLDGSGSKYTDSGPALDRINLMKASFEAMGKQFKKTGIFDPATFKKFTGVALSQEKIETMQALIESDVKYLSSAMTATLGEELGGVTSVGWTSNNHTSECVDLLSLGPGSRAIPGFIENYQLFEIMTHALQLKV